MADRNGDPLDDAANGPSLELPSLFRRRRSRAAPPPSEHEDRQAGSVEPAPAVDAETDSEAEPGTQEAPDPHEQTEVLPPSGEGVPALSAGGHTFTTPAQVTLDEGPSRNGETSDRVGREEEQDREFKLPALPGRIAALVTGLVVGLVGTLLTYAGLQGCEAVRGTDSCGGSGLGLLLVILVGMVLLGGTLLAAWDVVDPRATSLLAVGILCVLVLMLLVEELFEAWMFVAIPVASAAAYAASHWITMAITDEHERTR